MPRSSERLPPQSHHNAASMEPWKWAWPIGPRAQLRDIPLLVIRGLMSSVHKSTTRARTAAARKAMRCGGPAISMLGATPTPISADATAPSGSPSSTAHTLPPIPSRSSSSRAPTAPPRTSRSPAITRRPPRRRLRPSRRANSPPLVRLSHVNNSARASRSRTSAWETPLKPFNAPAASPRPRRAGSPPASSRVPAFPSRKRHTRTGTERGTCRHALTTPAILRGTNRVRGRATQHQCTNRSGCRRATRPSQCTDARSRRRNRLNFRRTHAARASSR